jgi:hypothetical protein
LVEADVHLFAGRLEVRHLKTVGPVPILWDRWELAPPWAPRLLLEELLAECAHGAELMLDLKGRDRRLPLLVRSAIAHRGAERPVTVCARRWELLEPLRGMPGVRLVHSVGSARQLLALRSRFPSGRLAGISIHRRLLDARTVRELRARSELLMCWPVETAVVARTVADWGVQGLITSHFEELAPVLAGDRSVAVAAV